MKKKIKLQVSNKARGKGVPKWIPPEKRMRVYDESVLPEKQKWVDFRIVVPDNDTRGQLLAAFEYIHDNQTLDLDFMAVNSVAHAYLTPEREKGATPCIIVDADLFKRMRRETCPHSYGSYFYDTMEFCKYCHKCIAY